LCIIPTLCNSTGQHDSGRRRVRGHDEWRALQLSQVKEPEIIRA
jgi:hypothetical protein